MSAKQLVLKAISRADADKVVKRFHYSGKVVANSQLNLGVFYEGRLEGAMQFGPPMDRRKLLQIVERTSWNGMVELNRMAFSDVLPRNSESRALSVAMRLLKNHAPTIEWVVSFADATQCGDGTIYRAAGFVLTGIKPNNQIWTHPTLPPIHRLTVTNATSGHTLNGSSSMKTYKQKGYTPLIGYQIRYVYFINPEARHRLTVPVLSFDTIRRMNARMYLGRPIPESGEADIPVGHKGAAMRPDGSICAFQKNVDCFEHEASVALD